MNCLCIQVPTREFTCGLFIVGRWRCKCRQNSTASTIMLYKKLSVSIKLHLGNAIYNILTFSKRKPCDTQGGFIHHLMFVYCPPHKSDWKTYVKYLKTKWHIQIHMLRRSFYSSGSLQSHLSHEMTIKGVMHEVIPSLYFKHDLNGLP